MGVLTEDVAEERAAGGDDDLVSFDLIVITGQSYVEKVFLLPKLPKGPADVGLEVIPLQAEFLRAHCRSLISGVAVVRFVSGNSGNLTSVLKLFSGCEWLLLVVYFSAQYGARPG